MTSGKLQSHFGCMTFVALLQISGVRPLPGLDCRVGIPGEPCGLRQEREVLGRERCFGVSLPKRIEGVVPCVPTVRVATLLNAILDELAHLLPVGRNGSTLRRPTGRKVRAASSLAGRVLDAPTICGTSCGSREHRNQCRHLPTPDRYDRTEGRRRCRRPDCTSSADTTGWGGSMRTSCSAAKSPATRGNIRHAGVAQSVAQLSCKQQVRGSSLLASSISAAFLRLRLDFSTSAQMPSHTVFRSMVDTYFG